LKPFNDEELLKIFSQALNRSHLQQNERAELFEIMVVRIGIRVPGPRANMAADSRSSTCVRNIDGPQKPIPTGT